MKSVKDALERIETINHVMAHRKKTRGIDYYTPNPHQLRGHKSTARTIILCGANRIGKSTFGVVELAWALTKNYPDWYPKERRFFGPVKAVVVCLENPIIEKVIEPKIREYIPRDFVKPRGWRRVTGGYLSKLICVDGSTVDFLTSEQDDMAFEGADWDFYWGDEPQRKRKFDAIQRGLVDRQGQTILTFTPLVEPWMKEELVDKADGTNIEVVTAVMEDNLFDIKGKPILKKEAIERFSMNLSEDVRETRVFGKFFHLRGIVYSEFSDIHTVEFDYDRQPVIAVLDPHDRQPHHVIWAFIDDIDDIYVHSEMSIHCTVQELAAKIRKHEKDNHYRMARRIIDPNFGRKPLITTGRNMIQELSVAGCPGWAEADDAKDEGRLKVKDYLHYNREYPVSHTNKPKIFFHRKRVPKTIHSVRNHQYEEWVGKIAGERDPKEKPKDKDTHGADCIRYLCMSNPRHQRVSEKTYEEEVAYY